MAGITQHLARPLPRFGVATVLSSELADSSASSDPSAPPFAAMFAAAWAAAKGVHSCQMNDSLDQQFSLLLTTDLQLAGGSRAEHGPPGLPALHLPPSHVLFQQTRCSQVRCPQLRCLLRSGTEASWILTAFPHSGLSHLHSPGELDNVASGKSGSSSSLAIASDCTKAASSAWAGGLPASC